MDMKQNKSFCLLALALVVLVASSCEPQADPFDEYIIRKGEHYTTQKRIQSLQSNTLSFDAKFNSSAIYYFDNPGFQDSKNKLLGFSDCNSLHHQNSARFAWQWYNDQLEIYAYCYVNNERVEKYVGVVNLDEVNHYEITLQGKDYVFQLNKQEPVIIQRGNVCNTGLYYMLWPYFGGSIPAPHQISIQIRIDY